jgi:S-adenosylmethionine-diacylglycerol 3-amino-3-carboxypropyl transferase
MSAEDLAVLDARLNYAQCWEDIDVLREALSVKEGERVLSICSAGDNSFAFCLDKASEVVCIDLSRPQLALAELKWLGVQELKQSGLMTLLGLNKAGRRVFLYHQLKGGLSAASRNWLDSNEELIREGLLSSGRFERYLCQFRQKVLPLIHRKKTVNHLLSLTDSEEQKVFYDRKWNNWRWQSLFRLFFSQRVMASRGRSQEQFAYVEGPVSAAILSRAKHALTEIPIASNPYLHWIFTGGYQNIEAAHPYLSTPGLEACKSGETQVQFVHQDLEQYLEGCPSNSFSAFNYSNIFEYLSEDQHRRILELTHRVATPGARIAYWNLFVPRFCPPDMGAMFTRKTDQAESLLHRDRAFFYGGFQLEVVKK